MLVMILALFLISILSVSADSSQNKKYIEKYIAESLDLMLDRIDVYEFGCRESEIFDAIDKVMKSNPDFYYVANKFYYSLDERSIVEEITPTYTYSAAEIKNIKAYCDGEISKILFSVDGRMSDFQKALTLHEYMCENFEYDTSFKNCNMYDLLRTGSGTCQAFTLTYMELLSRAGIESSYAYSDEIMHIWNLVRLDGEWYHVDITWDNIDVGVSHKNFLLTDREILDNGHRGFVNANGVECKGERYSGTSLQSNPYKCVAFKNGVVYADNISRSVYLDLLDGSEKTLLYRIDELWEKGEGRYYANSFSSPILAGNKVYFNTKNKIMEIDESFSVSLVKTLDFNAFGMADGEGLTCFVDRTQGECREIHIEKSLDADGDGELTVLDIAALDANLCRKDVFMYKYNVDANGDCLLDERDLCALESGLMIDKSA